MSLRTDNLGSIAEADRASSVDFENHEAILEVRIGKVKVDGLETRGLKSQAVP